MNEVESQVRDALNEAGSTVDQLREQLRASEVRCNELFEYGQFMERQLIEAKAELSRVEAEFAQVDFSGDQCCSSGMPIEQQCFDVSAQPNSC